MGLLFVLVCYNNNNNVRLITNRQNTVCLRSQY